jgi:hypothetical protein
VLLEPGAANADYRKTSAADMATFRLAAAEFRLYISSALYCQHDNMHIRNIRCSNPMNRRLAPSPVGPLLARFGRPDRRKRPLFVRVGKRLANI